MLTFIFLAGYRLTSRSAHIGEVAGRRQRFSIKLLGHSCTHITGLPIKLFTPFSAHQNYLIVLSRPQTTPTKCGSGGRKPERLSGCGLGTRPW